jgi:predicted nuclease of predicted toxin-antitoxin system
LTCRLHRNPHEIPDRYEPVSQWVSCLEKAGFNAVHWSQIGEPDAPDQEIFDYAKLHGYIVFTHDLDFGAILAATNAEYPSVIQIRYQDITPHNLSEFVISKLNRFQGYLSEGAMITIDKNNSRVRILPLRK